jgi:hypothetical protein
MVIVVVVVVVVMLMRCDAGVRLLSCCRNGNGLASDVSAEVADKSVAALEKFMLIASCRDHAAESRIPNPRCFKRAQLLNGGSICVCG